MATITPSNNVPKKRLEIFKNFQKHVQQKDDRSMDDICINPSLRS